MEGKGTQRLGRGRKKGRVRPINYTRRKNRGTATVEREEESRERKRRKEGRIVGSRDINRGGCAEARFLRVFPTPLLFETTTLHWPALSSCSLISATKFHRTPLHSRNKGRTRERCTIQGFVRSYVFRPGKI